MNSLFSFWRALFCFCWMPLYVGGDTSSRTDATVQNYDNRQVNTTTTQQYDLSSHVFDGSTKITNTVDGGAIQGMVSTALAAINGANTGATSAYDHADHMFSGVIDLANASGGRELTAYDRAATLVHDAMTGAGAAYQGAQQNLQAAYADAKGTSDSQKQIMLGVLALAGVMAFALMGKK